MAWGSAWHISMRLCKWYWVLTVQTRMIWTIRISWRFTSQPWIFMDWSTLVSSSLQEASPWWRRNTCWAHLATVQGYFVSDTMSYQLESRRSSPLHASKSTVLDVKMFIFQDRNNLTLMEHTSVQVSHTFSWSSFLSFCQKVQLSSCQKSMGSKFLEWGDRSMSWSLTIKESLSTRTKSAKFSEEAKLQTQRTTQYLL